MVADTEVFHPECVYLIPQSLTNRLKLKVIQLNARVATLQHLEREASQLRTALDDAAREASQARTDRDRYRRERDEAQTRSSTFRSANTFREADVTRAQQENERLARELEAARTELALHQTLAGARQQAPTVSTDRTKTPDPPSSAPSTMWEDMETRFGLLEIEEKK